MGQYCFAYGRLSSSSVVVCNAAGGRAGDTAVASRPPPGWACGRLGGRHCTAGQYGYVTLGRHLVVIIMIIIYNVLMRVTVLQMHCWSTYTQFLGVARDSWYNELSWLSSCRKVMSDVSAQMHYSRLFVPHCGARTGNTKNP